MIFRVSERERDIIYQKMALLKTNNKTAYLRKMACDGFIYKVDFSEFKEMFTNIGSVSRSINQIAKRVNSTERVYSEDIAELKTQQEEIWKLIKSMMSKIP